MWSRSGCGRNSQIEGFVGIKWQRVIGSKSGKACRHLAEGCAVANPRTISAVLGKDADHRSECPGGLLFPPEQLNGATFADGCKPEKNTSTKLVAARIPLPLQGVKSFAVDGLREKLWEFFRKEESEEGRAVAELTSTLDKPGVNAHRQFASSILS